MHKIKTAILSTSVLLLTIFTTNYLYPEKAPITKVPTQKLIDPNDPPCIQMYYCIKHYAKQYNIPETYAFAIAYYETGYQGPSHWKYNHALGKEGGAAGPMQILPIADKAINKKPNFHRLNNDIEYNIITSMKILRTLHNHYKDWSIVFGYYSTGKPQANFYSNLICNFTLDTKWIRC
jgi:hypothetical protein